MPTKICPKCKEEKDLEDFGKKCTAKDGKQSYCKICAIIIAKKDYKENNRKDLFSQREKEYTKKIIAIIDNIKAKTGCVVCGEKDPCCLDFHHSDPSLKDRNVSYFVYAKSLKKALAEIEKCVIMCANCHRKEHKRLEQSHG